MMRHLAGLVGLICLVVALVLSSSERKDSTEMLASGLMAEVRSLDYEQLQTLRDLVDECIEEAEEDLREDDDDFEYEEETEDDWEDDDDV